MGWKTKKYNIIISAIGFLSLTLICSCFNKGKNHSRVDTLPYYCEATFTPYWLSPDDPVLDTFHTVSDFTLIDQEGRLTNNNTFDQKLYVVDFFFTTCPGICPRMTKNMKVLQDEFITDQSVKLLSHSVTPRRDSVSVLKAYAENKEVNSDRWHLVTGSREEIYKLGRKDYFIEEDLGLTMEEDDFLHTENFVLIDKKRHLRGIYNGLNKASIKQLIADIHTLKMEK